MKHLNQLAARVAADKKGYTMNDLECMLRVGARELWAALNEDGEVVSFFWIDL